jgi:hypothetical protein
MTRELGFHHQSMTTSPVVRHSVIEHENEPFFTITSESMLAKIMITLPKTFDLPSYKYDMARRFVTVEPTLQSKKTFRLDFRKSEHEEIVKDLEIPYELNRKQKKVKGGRLYYDAVTKTLIFSYESSYFGECDHFEFMSVVAPFMMPYFKDITFIAMKCDDFIIKYEGTLIK